ncbi:tellurium resistance protein TerC [Chryseobacterium artocarpi]|uniref:Tellurium resistance protein TerC n=1 Tax=Chryseobacterium artocarpi TaxID=1414727 RepID=A0A1B8ZZS4_9FLAO|nr:DoxX family protein [Chryseobacterium artocarpi]OCA77095.1 tellurium resistance protein TerC [Chryseobacterium artocarpi]
MKAVQFLKKHFIKITSILLALLFIYAAASKMLDFENFQVQLAQSPLLSAYAGVISYTTLIVEFAVAILLLLPQWNRWGLLASIGLMSAFTLYIYLILNFSDFVPCSCGGILEKLGWTEHLIFNIAFLVLAVIALYVLAKGKGAAILREFGLAGAIIVLSCVAVIGLFQSSEHIIKKENNFTRRFLQHPVMQDEKLDLGVNSYYFAGMANGSIYLGNLTAPLLITKVDTGLLKLSQTKIALDNTDHPFRNVLLQVKFPNYYLYDGTVPIIFRGKLGDSTAHTLSYRDVFFNQLVVLDSMKFALRTQRGSDNQYTMALLDLNRKPKVELKDDILEKQIDGVFDVDGQMISDLEKDKIIYTYFYRNQYLVMDNDMNILHRLNTIDTTTIAQISVTKLSDGKTKMNAPPYSVNKSAALNDNLIFNRSNLKGKHEPAGSWRNSSIIDVYRADGQQYIGSFYIRNRNNKGMSSMISDGHHLYVLIDNELQRYKIRNGAFENDTQRNKLLSGQLVNNGEPKRELAENPVTE